MKEIKTQIQISSNPAEVWDTLMDFSKWSDWNPIVNKIEGKAEVGSELTISMNNSSGKHEKTYKSTVVSVEQNKRFSFSATMITKFMFSAERIITLEESQGGTLFIQNEIYSGFMVSLFWKKLSTEAVAMLNSMNEGLKKKVES